MENRNDDLKKAKSAQQWDDDGEEPQDSQTRERSDIFYTLAPIKHVSRIFGLLPVTFSQDKNGRWTGQLDTILIIYGILLVLGLVGAQILGLQEELSDGRMGSERFSSRTTIIICFGDIYAAVSVSIVAILGSPYRWRYLNGVLRKIIQMSTARTHVNVQEFRKKHLKVDEGLGAIMNNSLRRISNVVISLSVAYIVIWLGSDFILREISYEARNETSKIGHHSPINFAPLYLMHLFNLVFGLQYFLVVMHVSERFVGLNKAFENIVRINTYMSYIQKDLGLASSKVQKDSLEGSISSGASSNLPHPKNELVQFYIQEEGTKGAAAESFSHLIILHENLQDSVENVNKAYEGVVLVNIISCFIHLIIPLYVLYDDLHKKSNHWYKILVQFCIVLFHVYRLVLQVQPSFTITTQVEKTRKMVKQALESNYWDSESKKQLGMFALQLTQRRPELKSWGIHLNRGLITSIIGSVTTYLVIILEFQSDSTT